MTRDWAIGKVAEAFGVDISFGRNKDERVKCLSFIGALEELGLIRFDDDPAVRDARCVEVCIASLLPLPKEGKATDKAAEIVALLTSEGFEIRRKV